MNIKNVKGTHDLYGEEASNFTRIENILSQICELYAYQEIRIPIIEHSELFIRSVGESSDVVRKEMYTFSDKSDRSITLRPEFTAGIVRSIVQNKLLATNELPLKTYYVGPVFRYERPQLGRYRQFNQLGVEAIGIDTPEVDAEVIALAYTMLQSLNLQDVVVKINSLGDDTSRNNYKNALKSYFASHIENMCPDCQSRYLLNALRILDCKVKEDQAIIKDAPKMKDYLTIEAKQRFATLLALLDSLEIPYEIDDSLVRGLDYYSETVFEFHYTSKNNNNYGAIGAGGHYDKLVKELDGPDVSGVGFSFGVERLYNVMKDDGLLNNDENEYLLDGYFMPLGKEARKQCLDIATKLRIYGYRVDICFEDVKLSNMIKRAERKKSRYAFIIGDNEINNQQIIVKNLATTEQKTYNLDEFFEYLDENLQDEEDHCCANGCCHDKEE